MLKEQLKGKRLRLTDDQRRRLAAKGKRLGRALLNRVATIVTPDTIMCWHRRLISAKWTYEQPRTGRRRVMQRIKKLVIRFATKNSTWGYSRIQGELEELGHRVGRSTVARVLKAEGIKPAPERPTSWRTFLKAHWGQVAAADFFTTEVWTSRGLVTFYTLFVIDLKSRRVHIAASTPNPDGEFMAQIARGLTDCEDGLLLSHQALIIDCDSKFSAQFRRILSDAGIRVVLTPKRAPNCNAYAERFVRSIKEECLGRMMVFGEKSLRRALREYIAHYHGERPHQGVGNRVLTPNGRRRSKPGTEILATERLGGLSLLQSRGLAMGHYGLAVSVPFVHQRREMDVRDQASGSSRHHAVGGH